MTATKVEKDSLTEMQIDLYIQQQGQYFAGSAHLPNYAPQYFHHRSFHISISTLNGIAKKDFTVGKLNEKIYTKDTFPLHTDYIPSISKFEHNDRPSLKIPVTKGLNWSVKDCNSGAPLVAKPGDRFITLPSLIAKIYYDVNDLKQKYKFVVTYVGLLRVHPLIDPISYIPPTEIVDPSNPEQAAKENEENMEAWKKGELTRYRPAEEIFPGYIDVNPVKDASTSIAKIGFIGNQDNKNQFHHVQPVLWVRVDESYAKAHPKEVRKQGYFYYKNSGIYFNMQSFYNPLGSIYSSDDAEYRFNIEDLKDFKEAINEFVYENYGGYDVPLNIPISYKWASRQEHVGNKYALNIFVHPKGVL